MDSTLATTIRTVVILIFSWLVVFVTGVFEKIYALDRKTIFFFIFSGIATGGSWLCYYFALQKGSASIVVPIDKLSILVTIGFFYIVFEEKLSKKGQQGLLFIVIGTFLLLF